MQPTPLRTTQLSRKQSSDEIERPGDFYIVDQLGSTDPRLKKIRAIILKCPYCAGDMASTSTHKISNEWNWWRKLCGYPKKITVTPMLQCPYNPSHKFNVKNGKFIAE